MEVRFTPLVITFDDGGAVRLAVEQVDPADPESKELVGRYVGVTFAADDTQKTHDNLKARGVDWSGQSEHQYRGAVRTHFRDPKDNVLTIL